MADCVVPALLRSSVGRKHSLGVLTRGSTRPSQHVNTVCCAQRRRANRSTDGPQHHRFATCGRQAGRLGLMQQSTTHLGSTGQQRLAICAHGTTRQGQVNCLSGDTRRERGAGHQPTWLVVDEGRVRLARAVGVVVEHDRHLPAPAARPRGMHASLSQEVLRVSTPRQRCRSLTSTTGPS